jgi:hypothetical protein
MGLGGGRKVSRRGLIIIAALLFGIALSSRHTIDQSQDRSIAIQPNVLAMLSKKPTSGQMRRDKPQDPRNVGIGATNTFNMLVGNAKFQNTTYVNATHRSGVLHESETWTSKKTYVIDEEIVVPADIVLTIEPGTVIKVVGPGGGLRILEGGALTAQGTSEDPVFITSYRNDIVGGNTDVAMLRPQKGDYMNALSVEGGAQVTLNYTRISYADVGIVVSGKLTANNLVIGSTSNALTSYGGQTMVTDALFSDNTTTMLVRSGDVILRGLVRGFSSHAIQACSWNSNDCSVDAASVSWSDGNAISTDISCGRVLLRVEDPLMSQNCDGSSGRPAVRAAARDLQQRIDNLTQVCADNNLEHCDSAANARSCIDTGVASVLTNVAYQTPQGIASEQVVAWSDALVDSAESYIADHGTYAPQMFAFRDASSNVISTLSAATTILDSCAR